MWLWAYTSLGQISLGLRIHIKLFLTYFCTALKHFTLVITAADSPDQFNGSYPMAPRTDYKEEIQKFSTIKDTDITRERRMICYEQVIYDDLRLEMEEYAGLTLVADDSDTVVETEPLYDDSVFIIIDDDSKCFPPPMIQNVSGHLFIL